MSAPGPCTSRKTAPESLPTNPVSPSSVAIRWTNGRNPTPCTTPVTVNRCRTLSMCTSVSVIVTAPAHQLQTGHRLLGARPVGLLDDEPHVNDHPVTGCKRFLRHHADIHLALLSGDVDQCELPLVTVQHAHYLARYAQAHRSAPPFHRCRRRSSAQSRDDFLDGIDGSWHRARDGVGKTDTLLDAPDLAADDDRVGRFGAECLQAVEHCRGIHAVGIQSCYGRM